MTLTAISSKNDECNLIFEHRKKFTVDSPYSDDSVTRLDARRAEL
jgi:hypothetical protein